MVSAVKGRKLSLMEVKYTVEEAEEAGGTKTAPHRTRDSSSEIILFFRSMGAPPFDFWLRISLYHSIIQWARQPKGAFFNETLRIGKFPFNTGVVS